MGLFDKLANKKEEKRIDKVIENVKGLIAQKDYATAREALKSITDDYRKDDVDTLRKKAYPVEVKELATNREVAHQSGYRSLGLMKYKLKACDEVVEDCDKGCSYVNADGKRVFCRYSDHPEYKALANAFESYWGGEVYHVIEDGDIVYILAIEPDKTLWMEDKVMAYRVENRDVKAAVYTEVNLTTENGIPVIEKKPAMKPMLQDEFFVPERTDSPQTEPQTDKSESQHEVKIGEYFEKIKTLFAQQKYSEVMDMVEYMEANPSLGYCQEDMDDIYAWYFDANSNLMELKEGRYAEDRPIDEKAARKKKDILIKELQYCIRMKYWDLGIVALDRIEAECDSDYRAKEVEKLCIECQNMCFDAYGVDEWEDADHTVMYKRLKDECIEKLRRLISEGKKYDAIDLMLYVDKNFNSYYRDEEVGELRAIIMEDKQSKKVMHDEARDRIFALKKDVGLSGVILHYWQIEKRYCSSRKEKGIPCFIEITDMSREIQSAVDEFEKKENAKVYHMIQCGNKVYMLYVGADEGYWGNERLTLNDISVYSDITTAGGYNIEAYLWDMDDSTNNGYVDIELFCEEGILFANRIEEEVEEESVHQTETDDNVAKTQSPEIPYMSVVRCFPGSYGVKLVFAHMIKGTISVNDQLVNERTGQMYRTTSFRYVDSISDFDSNAKDPTAYRKEVSDDNAKMFVFFVETKDDIQSGDWIKKLVPTAFDTKEPDAEWLYTEGMKYYDGDGAPQDYAKALEYMEKSANLGNIEAQSLCGDMYYFGDGTAVDYEKALSWYEKAAGQNDPTGLYRCGIMYQRGEGVDSELARQDCLKKALSYYRKALENPELLQSFRDDAEYRIDEINETLEVLEVSEAPAPKENLGASVEEETESVESSEPVDSLEQTPKLINGYDVEEWSEAAMKYYNGDGVSKNLSNALWCMENAAKLGAVPAMYNCFVMYSQGQGTAVDEIKAFDWCKKAAENHHIQAAYILSRMFFTGNGCEQNIEEGLKWLKKSAEGGWQDGCVTLARFYEAGRAPVSQDKTQALFWYEKAAQLGHEESMVKCYEMYADGDGCETDGKKAADWLFKAVELGNADALCRVGKIALTQVETDDDIKEILKTYLIPSANKGDKNALFLCAEAFHIGRGVNKDEAKALQLYQRSAEKGCEEAQEFLVKLYTEGGIAEPDSEKALYWCEKLGETNAEYAKKAAKMYLNTDSGSNIGGVVYWLEKAAGLGDMDTMVELAQLYREKGQEEKAFRYTLMAAEHGDANAMHNCSVMYRRGMGTERYISKAVYWMKKAAEAGNLIDQLNCALMYVRGEDDVKVDYDKAFYWLQKAEQQRDAMDEETAAVFYALAGKMYYHGHGTAVDHAKAYCYWIKAAELGNVDAQAQCGEMYLNGIGTEKDEEKAFSWYLKAAEQGHVEAQWECGHMYFEGQGTAENFEKGLFWASKAAEQGHAGAQYYCGCMYAGKYGVDQNLTDQECCRRALRYLDMARKNPDIDAEFRAELEDGLKMDALLENVRERLKR